MTYCHLELLCWKSRRSSKEENANAIGAKIKFHKAFYLVFHRNIHNNFHHLYYLRKWLEELNDENRKGAQDVRAINNAFYEK